MHTVKYNWDVYSPFGVGLEDIFTRLESMSNYNVNYPPYNIIKNDESNYEIEIALAGFKSDEIEVSTEQNILKVAAKSTKRDSERTYLHKGLSKRSFSNSWQLANDVQIKSVEFSEGLLIISLEKIIPDHQKKTVYKIGESKPDPKFLVENLN